MKFKQLHGTSSATPAPPPAAAAAAAGEAGAGAASAPAPISPTSPIINLDLSPHFEVPSYDGAGSSIPSAASSVVPASALPTTITATQVPTNDDPPRCDPIPKVHPEIEKIRERSTAMANDLARVRDLLIPTEKAAKIPFIMGTLEGHNKVGPRTVGYYRLGISIGGAMTLLKRDFPAGLARLVCIFEDYETLDGKPSDRVRSLVSKMSSNLVQELKGKGAVLTEEDHLSEVRLISNVSTYLVIVSLLQIMLDLVMNLLPNAPTQMSKVKSSTTDKATEYGGSTSAGSTTGTLTFAEASLIDRAVMEALKRIDEQWKKVLVRIEKAALLADQSADHGLAKAEAEAKARLAAQQSASDSMAAVHGR
ncbi:hypothetical protein BC828DRAFT_393376 [Blastocladiella britannica]|nr:hypothetical protein BC828DRAFT_393376 [Blastocladiella britannica]